MTPRARARAGGGGGRVGRRRVSGVFSSSGAATLQDERADDAEGADVGALADLHAAEFVLVRAVEVLQLRRQSGEAGESSHPELSPPVGAK